MTKQQEELLWLIGQVDNLAYTETYKYKELPEAEYRALLNQKLAANRAVVAKIRELLQSGLDLNFEDVNHHTPLLQAVTQNDVELVQLLMEFGADIRQGPYPSPIHRAAEFGSDRVVRFMIEQGVDPRAKPYGRSVLAAARASSYSGRVVPMLLELLKPTKSQRGERPKKLHELAEERVQTYLDTHDLSQVPGAQTLRDIIEGIFVEEHSVTIQDFYRDIEEQGRRNPELVFACINLVKECASTRPKDKVVKKLAKERRAHFGSLEVQGNLDVVSLMVTGDLIVRGMLVNHEGRQLFVGGNVECSQMVTEGPVVVGGNLKAARIRALDNDYGLFVHNTLIADQLTVEDHHHIEAKNFLVKERLEKPH
jgi:hypothetical protein